MIIMRTSNTHRDFLTLTRELDAELKGIYGPLQAVYDQHNVIDPIDTAMVGYVDGEPVTCGCFKTIDTERVEIKRLYVKPNFRRKGFSSEVLQALEAWAVELGYAAALLETGKRQPEAIGLYRKFGYQIIANYGPYRGMENSLCMQKLLS
ncbi:MAG: GNAT family N-acetyltransferase [Deltaproteobacteria bacterium]|nr:GNAT family N-acetyltransferase [Deltaproteobacteria bacterium]